jgi:hypothetical protein
MTAPPAPDSAPTPEELRSLASDVEYEFVMLACAGMRLIEGTWDRQDGHQMLECNAWIEVLHLHLRNLIEFFAGRPRKDDVVAQHYVEDWTIESGGPELAWLLQRKRMLDKRLAHITAHRQRVSKDDDAEQIEDFRTNINAVYFRFCGLLTEEQRGWFDLVEDAEEEWQ